MDDVFETRGVTSSEIDSESLLSDSMWEGRCSVVVESRRSVNDRTDGTDEERSVKDRAEAVERVLLCFGRGTVTLSVASSKASCISSESEMYNVTNDDSAGRSPRDPNYLH